MEPLKTHPLSIIQGILAITLIICILFGNFYPNNILEILLWLNVVFQCIVTIFVGFKRILNKETVLVFPESWRIRIVEKSKGKEAAENIYRSYIRRSRQLILGIMEIIPGLIILVTSLSNLLLIIIKRK